MTRRDSGDALLLLAFLLSGAAALGYEILWTRLLPLVVGTEAHAVVGVLVGFFAGMGLGALALDRRVHRAASPLRWFMALELTAAGYALASPYILSWLPCFSAMRPGPRSRRVS